jgi:hypothetical protein
LKEESYLMDRDVDGRIILKCIFEDTDVSYGLDSSKDREKWWAPVNTVMNLQVP